MKTLAAVLFEKHKPLEFVELDLPVLQPGQVLVEMYYTSICGSQLDEIIGYKGSEYIPHVMGHEGYGIVADSNSGQFGIGETVVASWVRKRSDLPDFNIKYNNINSGQCATFLTYAVISEKNLYCYNEDSRPDLAPFLGCAIPTAFSCIRPMNLPFNYSRKRKVGIVGLGGVGMSVVNCLKFNHKVDLFVEDLDNKKVEISGYNRFDNFELDHIIDTTGSINSFNKYWGRQNDLYILSGNYYNKQININPMDFIFGKKIMGVKGSDTCVSFMLNYLIDELSEYSNVKGREYEFLEINDAINKFTLESKPVIKMK